MGKAAERIEKLIDRPPLPAAWSIKTHNKAVGHGVPAAFAFSPYDADSGQALSRGIEPTNGGAHSTRDA